MCGRHSLIFAINQMIYGVSYKQQLVVAHPSDNRVK